MPNEPNMVNTTMNAPKEGRSHITASYSSKVGADMIS
eukprot:CAMPEP_0183467056 /NCGR_PEP_ID=MMETSP0370-20130417/150183_1 /TAXON_ID=268820 /ORGANISM="Peridinium aciculiferum, Strain PAER-2" /LENGTH=36 /DNA_ID= /DNA_START= /DNA_END= /DNA_ORIENTATION=